MPELELPYRLIALDLDGTLLNPQKELTEGNRRALLAAAGRGTHIVPTTGRFFEGMPEAVRSLPCIRYTITINGAQVQDRQTGDVLYRAEIPNRRAIEVMEQLDTLPVIYDCYMDNWGYMTETLYAQGPAYIQDNAPGAAQTCAGTEGFSPGNGPGCAEDPVLFPYGRGADPPPAPDAGIVPGSECVLGAWQ